MPFSKETYATKRKKKIPKPTKWKNPLNPKKQTKRLTFTIIRGKRRRHMLYTEWAHTLLVSWEPWRQCFTRSVHLLWQWVLQSFSQLFQPHRAASKKPQEAHKMRALQPEVVWLTLAAKASPELWDCPAGPKPHYPGYAWFLLVQTMLRNIPTALG